MDPIERLREREQLAELGGGEERLKKRHAQGKLTARERMTRLFDAGTFEEVDKLVTHRCQDFGMEQQIIPGDVITTGTPSGVGPLTPGDRMMVKVAGVGTLSNPCVAA